MFALLLVLFAARVPVLWAEDPDDGYSAAPVPEAAEEADPMADQEFVDYEDDAAGKETLRLERKAAELEDSTTRGLDYEPEEEEEEETES